MTWCDKLDFFLICCIYFHYVGHGKQKLAHKEIKHNNFTSRFILTSSVTMYKKYSFIF